MFFSAIVLDNSKFFEKGFITVRVAVYYNAKWEWDLSKETDIMKEFKEIRDQKKTEEGTGIVELVEDFDNCLVGSPMGTGRNYGMFYLPQINSTGVITFLDAQMKKPLWMGGFFRPIKIADPNKLKKTDVINIPSDSGDTERLTDADGAMGEIQGESRLKGKQVSSQDGALIIRTKSTDEDDYDWQSKGAENLIVVDGDKINITHYIEWEDDAVTKTRSAKKYQKIEIGNTDEEVKLSTINLTTDTKSELSMKEDNFSMKVTGSDGEDVTGIECSADAVRINKNNEQELIKIADNGIFIKSTGTVEITGSSVRIKGAGNRIVTTTAAVGQKIASLGELAVSSSEAE
tara:strand:+ start:166 stop:1203 length:1038 start_codon:yes stop_codon:yes gene_type:complete